MKGKNDNALIEEYYRKALDNFSSDRIVIQEKISKMEIEIQKIDAQFRRYRSSKDFGYENHKDNELRKSKIFYTNWIEIGRKTLNQIDFTKEVLTKNKTNIILQRIAVEDKLLADELNRRKKDYENRIAELQKQFSSESEKYDAIKAKIKITDDSIFGKIRRTVYTFKLNYHKKRVAYYTKSITVAENELGALNKIKNVRDSDFYERFKADLDLVNKGKFHLLFSSDRNWPFEWNNNGPIPYLNKRYTEILEELRQNNFVTSDEIYNLSMLY